MTLMTDSDDVLTANLAFYQAFTGRDIAAMEALWARQAQIICVHPGWPPLSGREAVMWSWRNILSNPEQDSVACHDDQAFLYGDFAIVICEEELAGGHLVATNMFLKEGGRWRLFHHQASPLVVRAHEARPQRPH
jgi:ketosteroid isomerase-like protein